MIAQSLRQQSVITVSCCYYRPTVSYTCKATFDHFCRFASLPSSWLKLYRSIADLLFIFIFILYYNLWCILTQALYTVS